MMQFNRNGGLTLIPLMGFEEIAQTIKRHIEEMSSRPNHFETPVDITSPVFGLRPSKEQSIKLGTRHIEEHDCVVITSGPGTCDMLMNLLWTLGYLSARNPARMSVLCPYFPLARSDKNEGDEFALPPIVMDMVMGVTHDTLKRVICVDPHSEQVVMAVDAGKLQTIFLTRRLLDKIVSEAMQCQDALPFVIAFPDYNASVRYKAAISKVENSRSISLKNVIAYKHRSDASTTRIIQIVGDLSAVKGARVIMIDDEIATGGSVITLAKTLMKEFGAKSIWAAASHGVLCGGANDLFIKAFEDGFIDRVIVTDTIPIKNRVQSIIGLVNSGRLSVMSCLEDMAWVIYNYHWGNDIREMR